MTPSWNLLEPDDAGAAGRLAAPQASLWSRRHTGALVFGLLACILVLPLLCYVTDLAPFFPSQPPAPAERAAVASPRTIPHSIRDERGLSAWRNFHSTLAAEAAAAKPLPDGQRRLVFVGDSIMETWRGTQGGRPVARAAGVPEVLRERFGAHGPQPLVLGIACDQTQHVLWRLSHGELPAALAGDAGAFFVLLIGTNNLGYGQLPDEALAGIIAVARYLLANSAGQLLVVDLLPRGDGDRIAKLCPPRCDEDGGALKSFMPWIGQVNLGLQRGVAHLSTEFHGRVRRVNCGAPFLDNGTEVRPDLMPDRLHPNAQGYRVLARCIQPFLPRAHH